MPTSSPPPTARQLRYLRQLACERGVTFAWPATIAAASHEIDKLKRQPRSSRTEQALDRRAVVLRDNPNLHAARFRDDEIEGYGSTASWAGLEARREAQDRS